MEYPFVLHVPCFQKQADEGKEPSVPDFPGEYFQEFVEGDVVKEPLDVSLYYPVCSFTGRFDLYKCCMTGSFGSKPV